MTNDKQKDRLVELLDEFVAKSNNTTTLALADHILADGWMRPPCKVGQTVYFIHRLENSITEHEVDNFYVGKKGISIKISGVMHPVKPYEFGRIFFSIKEEAEKALGGVQG